MKVKGFFAVAAATFGLAACAPTSNTGMAPIRANGTGIVGGVEVEPSDVITSMTGLLIDVEQGSICTASILSEGWVLTAGHCVDGSESKNLVVVFVNKFDDKKPEEMMKKAVKVKAFTQHPKYAETMTTLEKMVQEAEAEGREITMEELDKVTDWGDVALVQLDGTIPQGYKAAPILAAEQKLTAGQNVTLAGYGITSGGPFGGGEGTLRKVDVSVSEPVWGQTEVLMDQTQGKGACHGDSGGPAYATVDGQLALFGVTSRGIRDDNDTCTRFSAYTNIQHYRDWIKEVSGL